MKIKKVTFEHTGIFESPVKNKWYCHALSKRYFYATYDFFPTEGKYERCIRTETVEEWKPKAGEDYYTPAYDGNGEADYTPQYFHFHRITAPKEFTFIFPTPEVATAQAQKWLDEAKEKTHD